MNVRVFPSGKELAQAAADHAAEVIQQAIGERERAFVILATGNSQLEFLSALVKKPDVDWSKTVLFQLDEYIGLPSGHPASFATYIRKNVLAHIRPEKAYLIEENDAKELSRLVARQPVDIAFSGIGENGHLAFNDPPADFDTEEPYIVVQLDKKCREQQVGEGWFPTFDDVPKTALSMSIRQILKSREIVCVVPDLRKAEAVRDCLGGPITNMHPASILQTHGGVTFYLDKESSSLLLHRRQVGDLPH